MKQDEMWAALAKYQDTADEKDHGDTWSDMCRLKTADAWDVAWAALAAHTDWAEMCRLRTAAAAAHEAELARYRLALTPMNEVGSMWGQAVIAAGTVASETLVVTPMRKRLSLWRRIKAVFTGDYA
jgi:hypothetical protein